MPTPVYFLPILFGVVHGLIFSGLLLIRSFRTGRPGDRILALLVVAGCLRITPYLLGFLDINLLWNEFMFLPLDTGLLIGPLVLIYVRAQTNAEFRFGRADAVHLIPYALFALYRLLIFSQDSDFVFEWIDRVDLPWVQPALTALTGLSLLTYLALAYRHLIGYRHWLETEYAEVEAIDMGWIRSFLVAMTLAILTAVLFGLAEWLGRDFDLLQAWWPFGVTTATVYYLSVGALIHPQSGRVTYRVSPDPAPRTLQVPELPQLAQRLGMLMQSEQLFLQPELSLENVAARFGESKAITSQTINEGFGLNFRGFVNAYRVHAVKAALSRPGNEHLTLVGVALENGFNSKATFNRVFKQLSGITPREFAELPPSERAALPQVQPLPVLRPSSRN